LLLVRRENFCGWSGRNFLIANHASHVSPGTKEFAEMAHFLQARFQDLLTVACR
jgi:hypothetical protein